MKTSLKYFFLLFILLKISNCYSQKYFDPFSIDKMKQGDTITFYTNYFEHGMLGGPVEKDYLTIIEDKIWVHYYKQRLYLFFRILRSKC